MIPLFPELKRALQELDHITEPGTVRVIARYRDATQNLRTELTRIIEKAKLTAWPKPG